MTERINKPALALAKEAFVADAEGFKELFRRALQEVLEAEMTEALGAAKGISELDGIGRRDIERIKGMLSRQTDSARLSYEKTTSSVPRQFILMGTSNDHRYLQDHTGNRRFWPVRVGSVDFEALKQDRDQLWSEAVHYEATGESLELPANLWKAAAELQG